jgi:hypothetical protein
MNKLIEASLAYDFPNSKKRVPVKFKIVTVVEDVETVYITGKAYHRLFYPWPDPGQAVDGPVYMGAFTQIRTLFVLEATGCPQNINAHLEYRYGSYQA